MQLKLTDIYKYCIKAIVLMVFSPICLSNAQNVDARHSAIPVLTLSQLDTGRVNEVTVRKQFPGVLLSELGEFKYIEDDDPIYARSEYDDHAWQVVENTSCSNFSRDRVYWCRTKFTIDESLKGKPLSLAIYWKGAMEVYMNGVLIYAFGELIAQEDDIIISDSYFMPVRTATIIVSEPNDINVLSFRFGCHSRWLNEFGDRFIISTPKLDFSIYLPETSDQLETARLANTSYYGVFIGMNAIIILLSLFQISRKRDIKVQLHFALFTFCTMLLALTNLADKGLLELSSEVVLLFAILNIFVHPSSSYFLLVVMRGLFDADNKRTPILYFIYLLLLCIINYIVGSGIRDISVFLLALHIISFVELIRLSLLSFKKQEYGAWIIITGAVIFLLGGPILERFYDAIGMSLTRPFWSTMVIRVTYYLSMPISLSVFLSLQIVRSNRLLARQRDELDLEVYQRTDQLNREKQRSDELLLNILPADVAEELKDKGAADARLFSQVTVMFTDFKGFTQFSEKLTPAELVAEINTCFSAFDNIMERYGIEKIKTIGDAYMAAGGLSDASKTPAEDVIRACLEIQQFMAEYRQKKEAAGDLFFEIRIGVHTGPVVAGIVGVKKFAYDIWGDTVNTASRMESSGEVGKINISGATYQLIRDSFICTHRGNIQAKGKGEIAMYFVEGQA